jgi:plastocyanin
LNPTLRPAVGRIRDLMSVPPSKSRVLAVVASLALLFASMAGLGAVESARAQGVQVDSSGYLNVTAAYPFKFVPNSYEQLPTNATINVAFTDADTAPHTFTILDRQGWVIPASADLSVLFSTYGTLVGINASGSGTFTHSFTSPGPGWYEFVCLEPGHFTSGMYGFIAFGMNLPGNLTVSAASTAPGAAVFIIVGTIASLVVIALVLGFVVGRRRGSEFEMPPERLGYAEPPTAPVEEPLPTRGPPKG